MKTFVGDRADRRCSAGAGPGGVRRRRAGRIMWPGAAAGGCPESEKGRLALRRILEADHVDENTAWKAFDQLSAAERAMFS